MHRFAPYALVAVVAVFGTAALIYLTPLRYTDLVAPPAIRDVDPKAFYDDFTVNKDKYLFIDVRQAAAYAASHAVGSVNIPLQNLYDTRHTLPKQGKIIALICTSGAASGVGYAYLQYYGFTNIIRIHGGVENWAIEGLPLEGADVIQPSKTSRAGTDALAFHIVTCNAS